MLQLASDPGIQDDINNGRVPIISWNCADDATLDKNGKPLDLYEIQHGLANTDLQNIRLQLLQLKAQNGDSYPVILRYFWEFNINAAGGQNANTNNNGGCFGTDEDYTDAFKGAWIQIWNELSNFPSPNRPDVSFDWNPNVNDNSADDAQWPDFKPYYPGPSYVDWIGADGYNKEDSNGNPVQFTGIFNAFYSNITQQVGYYGNGLQKPMMIGETGTCQQYTTPHNDQVSFLQDVIADMPTNYPDFVAIDYFDAKGRYNPPGGCYWTFNSSGLQEFATMGQQPYFQPTVSL